MAEPFTFNFSIPENEEAPAELNIEAEFEKQLKEQKQEESQAKEGNEIFIDEELIRTLQQRIFPKVSSSDVTINKNLTLERLNGAELQNLLAQRGLTAGINLRSDLIPAVYEGGFKLWECSIDLIHFMIEEKIQLQGKKVLDIGCGHGLPAIYCLLNGAAKSHFQDYNDEVLQYLTVSNLLLNKAIDPKTYLEEEDDDRVCLFGGDWDSLTAKHAAETSSTTASPLGETYDILLTADTLYSLKSHAKLLRYIQAKLSKNKGSVAYVAAKSFYFGVGGDVQSFELLVEKDGRMNVENAKLIMDGATNVRQILALTWK